MINIVQDNRKHRNDIDGLRAIAILGIIIFHFGYLPNGFLGVDVFFVISGFLITGGIYKKINENDFSIKKFYLKRIRRIIPLVLFVSLISLVVGITVMLPDDLDDLAQSVIATNLFSNNILQTITSSNYWSVANESKPLIHTWFLGALEQCYLLYPFLFMLVGKKRLKWLLPILSTFAVASLTLYLLPYYQEFQKFYLVFFRFWEIGAGGITAIALKDKRIDHKYSVMIILVLVLLLCFDFSFISRELTLLITVLLTLGILATSNQNNDLSSFILENKLLVAIGKISFSMYLWHQVLLAYARYFVFQELHLIHLIVIFIIIIIFSVISYLLIEEQFSYKNKINDKKLFLALGCVFFLTSAASFYIYLNAGVLKDIPELGIKKSDTERGMHLKYNERIDGYDNNFKSTDRIKVLVIGDSFGRDFANVLLESSYANDLEISYIGTMKHKDFKGRIKEADIIFFVTTYTQIHKIHELQKIGLQGTKLRVVGTKNFGISNGIFYNYMGKNYYKQRTLMAGGYLESNNIMRQEWGDRYINYIGKVIDHDPKVPVFTPDNKFISHDNRHFTKAGAQYFAKLLENDLAPILGK